MPLFGRQFSFSRKKDALAQSFKKVAGKTGTVDENGLHKVIVALSAHARAHTRLHGI